jgi:hypothetical protein
MNHLANFAVKSHEMQLSFGIISVRFAIIPKTMEWKTIKLGTMLIVNTPD